MICLDPQKDRILKSREEEKGYFNWKQRSSRCRGMKTVVGHGFNKWSREEISRWRKWLEPD